MDKTINNVLLILNKHIDSHIIGLNNIDDKLTDLGMDSILFIQIVVALEEAFEIEIPDEKLLIPEMYTINKMLDVILHSPSNKYYVGIECNWLI